MEVSNFFLDYVFGVVFEGLVNCDFFFTMEQHHWVEFGNARHREVAISKWTSVANDKGVCGEWGKILIIFVGVSEVASVHRVLLETNAKGVEDCILLRHCYLVGFHLVS